MDCLSVDVLTVVRYIKVAINIIRVLIPIGLIISIMLSLFKEVASNDVPLDKAFKLNANKMIATAVIFLLPPIISLTFNLISNNTTYDSCWINAEPDNINKLAINQAHEEIEKLNNGSNLNVVSDIRNIIDHITDEELRDNYTNELNKKVQVISDFQSTDIVYDTSKSTTIVNPVSPNAYSGNGPVDSSISYGKNMAGDYVVKTPVSLVTIDTKDSAIGCTLKYGNSVKTSLQVNKAIEQQMKTLLTESCTYVKNFKDSDNTNYPKQLDTGGVYNSGSSYSYPHAYALGIDLNNSWTYKYNGVTYTPYSSYANSTNYRKFICEVCKGDETCPQNINYHIYEQYFKPAGWCWGGYWGESNFDPMHFEYKRPWANSCSTSNKIAMNCSK